MPGLVAFMSLPASLAPLSGSRVGPARGATSSNLPASTKDQLNPAVRRVGGGLGSNEPLPVNVRAPIAIEAVKRSKSWILLPDCYRFCGNTRIN